MSLYPPSWWKDTMPSPTFSLLLLLISLLLLLFPQTLNPQQQQQQPTNEDDSYISLKISQNGLVFIKDILVNQAISSLTPLHLPQIQKDIQIPILGNVHLLLSNITIYSFHVASSSEVKIGDSGVTIVASGATCQLGMDWYYSYTTWVFPVRLSDHGSASVQVEGMQVGLTLSLENQGGSLKLSLLDCGCYVEDISIKLDGGASWLYQGIFDAFGEQIGSAVESAVTNNLKGGVSDLDKFLQALPKEIEVDDNASLNVTFVNDLSLDNSSIEFQINGLFTNNSKTSFPNHLLKSLKPSVSCSSPKMLGISLAEEVFNSASTLYYNAKFLQTIIDKAPDQSLLNTAGWRFIVPQLYKKYPKRDMNLNISLSSPPEIRITSGKIDATAYVDLIVGVLDENDTIPVTCISLVTRGSGSVKINGNNLAGSVKLNDFSMKLKWSNIGKLHLNLIQPIVWTVIETVVIPNVNSYLANGFPLPIIHGFTLKNAEIILSDSDVNVCSDVEFTGSFNLSPIRLYRDSSFLKLSKVS